MSLRIIESEAAGEDRMSIALYISSRTSLEMGKKFLTNVEAAYLRLSEMPRIGAPRQYRDPTVAGLRMWPVPRFPNHLIFYIPDDNSIEIIRILHGARNIEEIFAGDSDINR